MVANRVARVVGMSESNERFLSLALFQGQARPDVVKAARLGDASRKVSLPWTLKFKSAVFVQAGLLRLHAGCLCMGGACQGRGNPWDGA